MYPFYCVGYTLARCSILPDHFSFDLMAVHVRLLSARYSPQELSVYRNVLGVLPTVVLLAYTRELSFSLGAYRIKQDGNP